MTLRSIQDIERKITEIRKNIREIKRPLLLGIVLDILLFTAAAALVFWEWWGYNWLEYNFWSDSHQYPWWHWHGDEVKICCPLIYAALLIAYYFLFVRKRRKLIKKRIFISESLEQAKGILEQPEGEEQIYQELDKIIPLKARKIPVRDSESRDERLKLIARIEAFSWIASPSGGIK